ncbi:hypothetical protein [Priestia megaterium]|uniref:hypothetical protein n=1 Tax=Priestia megaterium TaxID=1404 RepID=UPI001C52D7F0|nr:hypothetical protein [Priestia megaterium]MBW0933921.1 hypothetical protein [Priestia megaterium]
MWAIPIESSFTGSLASEMSEHFEVFKEYTMSESELFYLSSIHLDNISIEDPLKASYRAKALLRILNGILLLTDNYVLVFDVEKISFINHKGEWINRHVYGSDRDLEYKELENPFQAEASKLVKYKRIPEDDEKKRDYIVDFFDYAYKSELVKEVLILFSLSKIDTLFILINTYKIIETIEYDLGFIDKTAKTEKIGLFSEEFVKAYEFFEKGKFGHYSNSEYGSGLFSRHGVSDKKKYEDKKGNPLPPVSFNDIDINVRTLIYEWINHKLMVEKGYRYPSVKREIREEQMKDEDYNFDL